MAAASTPTQNRLLAALPREARDRIFPDLQLVELPLGKVLYESGAPAQYVYFPCNAIVSLLYVLESGASAEIAVVGNEGIVGVAVFMGRLSLSCVVMTSLSKDRTVYLKWRQSSR